MKQDKVDIVLPYVDLSDKLWLKDFIITTRQSSPSSVRFRSWGTLLYVLRAIENYIPFVRNIVLVVARESQIPDWLDRSQVRIVYHQDFIPTQYLPTFNSCTIEAFLYNIPDLTEQFLYTNDDIFPINPTQLSDFFLDGKPRIKFAVCPKSKEHSIFGQQSLSSLNFVLDVLGCQVSDDFPLIMPEHSITPMLKSAIDQVGELSNGKLERTISYLREPKNVNQHIYSDYLYLTDSCTHSKCSYAYIDLSDDLVDAKYGFLRSNVKLLCLNDSNHISNYDATMQKLCYILEQKYPNKCKYEK